MYSAPAYCCQVSGIYPDCPVFWLFVRYKNDSNTGQCMCAILLYLQYLNSFCQCPVYFREPSGNPINSKAKAMFRRFSFSAISAITHQHRLISDLVRSDSARVSLTVASNCLSPMERATVGKQVSIFPLIHTCSCKPYIELLITLFIQAFA